MTESEDELSSRVSYDTVSLYFALTHFSPQHEFQEQPEFQEQLEFTNNLCQSEDIEQITLDRFLKAPDVKILTNNVVDSKLSNGNGYEKKCPKVFSFKTSTTHLGEHLNAIHQLFSQQQIEKNSEIIESNKSIQTIPSIFAKLDSHKLAKQQKLLFLLTAWVVEDCQALTIVEGQKFRELCYEMDPCFKVPGSALVKTKIRESVYMWTSMHRPYIGITIHWLSKNFELYQAVLTIEEFPYSHLEERQEQFLSKIFEHWNIHDKLIRGTTDNDKSVVKGMRLLETPYIHCIAYTIQLAIKDGLSACDNILSKAKKLNNWLVKRDRYRQSLHNIQNEFNQLSTNISEDSEWPLLENEDSDSEPEDLYESLAQSSRQVKKKEQSIIEPIRDIKMRWNSTFFVLKRLIQLRDAIEQLENKRLLSEEEWNELEDLLKLLSPFAQSTKLIGGAQYLTLGMMLPTISLLLSHIRQMKTSLTRWESPPIEAYFASYLDPQFKNLSFANTPVQMKMDQLYNGVQLDFLIENEIE
ncbi:3640_t:CDS:2 [Cetraspora pellucida]|uniref:3640_t:CDS:1 n=1 Tax=Cetraspora pellucida TaxID=1433469 RepID=A0ACA9N645_9GLOM|nr:3640_t:CDS:2 [Cetraspora pellucida]